jgi:hypothetical protein
MSGKLELGGPTDVDNAIDQSVNQAQKTQNCVQTRSFADPRCFAQEKL